VRVLFLFLLSVIFGGYLLISLIDISLEVNDLMLMIFEEWLMLCVLNLCGMAGIVSLYELLVSLLLVIIDLLLIYFMLCPLPLGLRLNNETTHLVYDTITSF
jgi:hypothetical protein